MVSRDAFTVVRRPMIGFRAARFQMKLNFAFRPTGRRLGPIRRTRNCSRPQIAIWNSLRTRRYSGQFAQQWELRTLAQGGFRTEIAIGKLSRPMTRAETFEQTDAKIGGSVTYYKLIGNKIGSLGPENGTHCQVSEPDALGCSSLRGKADGSERFENCGLRPCFERGRGRGYVVFLGN